MGIPFDTLDMPRPVGKVVASWEGTIDPPDLMCQEYAQSGPMGHCIHFHADQSRIQEYRLLGREAAVSIRRNCIPTRKWMDEIPTNLALAYDPLISTVELME